MLGYCTVLPDSANVILSLFDGGQYITDVLCLYVCMYVRTYCVQYIVPMYVCICARTYVRMYLSIYCTIYGCPVCTVCTNDVQYCTVLYDVLTDCMYVRPRPRLPPRSVQDVPA